MSTQQIAAGRRSHKNCHSAGRGWKTAPTTSKSHGKQVQLEIVGRVTRRGAGIGHVGSRGLQRVTNISYCTHGKQGDCIPR